LDGHRRKLAREAVRRRRSLWRLQGLGSDFDAPDAIPSVSG
jgi:hypothetical protein